MLRATRLGLALAASLLFAGPASAVTFGLDFLRDGNEITFTISLSEEVTTLIGYEFAIQYDDAELDWNGFTDLSEAESAATPAPGNPNHDPDGMKSVALSLFSNFSATDLFSLSFLITSPVDDGAFDDFRVLVTPAGCEALEGCSGIPTAVGLQRPIGTPAVPLDNLGYLVEIGAETTSVSAVPEPAAVALLAAALAPLAALRRRR